MGRFSFRRLLAGVMLAASVVAAPAAEPLPAAHVLLLNSYGPGRPGFDTVVQAFVRRLQAGGLPLDHIHIEYLHLDQPNADEVAPARRALLQAQYGGQRIGLVVALQQPALNFAFDELAGIAPQAPLLTDSEPAAQQLAATRRAVFKYAILPDVGATMKDVMQLLPRTRRVVIPAGVSEADQVFQRLAEADLAPWLPRLQVEFLHRMSWAEQLRYVARLGPDTVVVAGMFNRDRDGLALPTIDATRDIMREANVPVFVLFDSAVGEGAVGGAVRGLERSGSELAEHALAALAAPQLSAGSVTAVKAGPVLRLYDWRQLERWHIDPAPLEGATILFRSPSLWQAYRGAVLGAGAVIALLAGMLGVMLAQRRRLARTPRDAGAASSMGQG